MADFLNPLLTLLLVYGYPVVAGVILLTCFGAPFPSEPLLLAAGSLTVDGGLHFYVLIAVATAAAVFGDVTVYGAGRKIGIERLEKYTHRIGITEARVKGMEQSLQKYGGWGIFVTRWLLTPLAIPVNILCGMSGYPFKWFLLFALVGELIWASIYVYLGFLFGANWVTLLDYIEEAPFVSALVIISVVTLYSAIHLWRRH